MLNTNSAKPRITEFNGYTEIGDRDLKPGFTINLAIGDKSIGGVNIPDFEVCGRNPENISLASGKTLAFWLEPLDEERAANNFSIVYKTLNVMFLNN